MATGTQTYYIRSDPPLLRRRCDAAAVAALVVVSVGAFVVTAWPAPLLGIPLAVTYAPLVMMARLGWRWRTKSLGDESIKKPSVRPAASRCRGE